MAGGLKPETVIIIDLANVEPVMQLAEDVLHLADRCEADDYAGQQDVAAELRALHARFIEGMIGEKGDDGN